MLKYLISTAGAASAIKVSAGTCLKLQDATTDCICQLTMTSELLGSAPVRPGCMNDFVS
jgi:hypothetical protein